MSGRMCLCVCCYPWGVGGGGGGTAVSGSRETNAGSNHVVSIKVAFIFIAGPMV